MATQRTLRTVPPEDYTLLNVGAGPRLRSWQANIARAGLVQVLLG